MAGTRYRSGFGDTAPSPRAGAAATRRLLGTTQPTSPAQVTTTAVDINDVYGGIGGGDGDVDDRQHQKASMLEMAEGIAGTNAHYSDSGTEISSSRPSSSSAARSTEAYCSRCKTRVGEFYNAWHKVTNTYFLPALVGSYTSLLNRHGRQKTASKGTVLEECSIQPLSCPAPDCLDTLGITVVDAPEGKDSFRHRDLFKLSRIELRCKDSPDKTTIVDPQVEEAPQPLAIEETQVQVPSPIAVTSLPPPPPTDAMEVDTRPPPPLHSGPHSTHHEQHHEHRHHQHQPLQTVEANRQTLPPPSLRSPSGPPPMHSLPQKSPSNPPPLPSPAVKPVHDAPYAAALPARETSAGATNPSRELPPVTAHSRSPGEQHRPNGQYYPRPPPDVQLDAIERLQTQISQNSGALAAQSRDIRRFEENQQVIEDNLRREFQSQLHLQSGEIRRVDDAIRGLQHEIGGMRELIEGLRRDVHASRGDAQTPRGMSVAPGAIGSAQDSALELMAQQVAIISHKANEVDTLKITIEIMKNKIQRLEDASTTAPGQPSSAHPYQSPREPSAHSTQSTHALPSYHNTPSIVPHINPPVHPSQRAQSFHNHGASSVVTTPEVQRVIEPPQSSSGWVTVNSATKRPHQNSIDSPHDSIGQSIGSPKRQKLTTIEPRVGFPGSQTHPQQSYDHMDTDDSEGRMQTHSHTLPSQALAMSEATHAPQPSAYMVPYGTQEGHSDESWRADAQRIIEHRPRGRGRGGGPGSRGGRGRKSLPTQVHILSTPEWDKEEWQVNPDLQTSPEGYYHHAGRPGRGIARRGSGGSGGTTRGGRPSSSSDRAVSLGLQGVTAGVGIGLPADPYAHTKKTRTKPTRNADGILIRKDGRPDMRSQSSAANLRKVHARKEEQKGTERGFTPSNLHHTTAATPETPSPSPTGFAVPGHDVTASVQRKHNAIMGKMFPGGVDESRKEHDYSRKVFEEEQDHTAHPRSQNHARHGTMPGTHPYGFKDEHVESPNDGDLDMDRADDQADDEEQTPGRQSDNSEPESQYQDAQHHPEPHRQEPKNENGVQNPIATVESSATVAAESPKPS